MKKTLILACFSVLVFSSAAFALSGPPFGGLFHSVSYLSEGLIMSEPLPAGGMCLSGNIEYYSLSDMVDYSGSSPKWEPLDKENVSSATLMTIPIKFAYGITPDLSVRATISYVSSTVNSDMADLSGSGIGDARIEGLYRFVKESESMPSIAGNIGLKLATGTHDYDKLLSDQILATGTGATDIYASVIFGKNLGPVIGKALLGYELTGAMKDFYGKDTVDVDPADPILFSLALLYPATPDLEIGGELYGCSGGKDIWKSGSDSATWDKSNGSFVWLSPYLSYRVSPAVTVKGIIDYPISIAATNSLLNGGEEQLKGLNFSIGADWAI